MKAVLQKVSESHKHQININSHYSVEKSPASSLSSNNNVSIQRKPSCPCGGGCPRCRGVIQPKFIINQPGDFYEQEADRVADQVMRMSDPVLQRRCANFDEDKENVLQTKELPGELTINKNQEVPSIVHEVLRSPGQPLDSTTRAYMEPRFGHDFSKVRVHTDTKAARSAQDVSALAYTVGLDVVFGSGQYTPRTTQGKRLIAHEMTHVAQQAHIGKPLVQRQPKPVTEPWLVQINDILPRNVGLLTDIDRIGQLVDRFTTDQLNELIGLIHADPAAMSFTSKEAGVPGIFALQDTRIGKRLDVAAARFLLERFPTHPPKPRKSDEKKADVFSADVVRDAYIRFHYNAILPGKNDPASPDLPNKIRQDCIAIVHALAPQLFTSESVVKRIEKSFKKLREKGETYTMVHTGEALVGIGVADPRVKIKFKDAAGRTTNGDTEPTTLASSAWDKVMDKVGKDFGWHIFGMAIMDGHHSVTLFVDNQPEGKTLFWADQWRIDPGDDFFQLPGAISGFRQYDKAGFDKFIETMTNEWWNDVHQPDSKCGKAKGKNWDSGCRYNATLMLWQLRKVVER